MRNIQDDANVRLKGYLIKGDRRLAFWYSEHYKKDISENFGQPVADGHRVLTTESNLNFEQNNQVLVSGELLTIDNIHLRLKDNLNSLRGAASYVKEMIVK